MALTSKPPAFRVGTGNIPKGIDFPWRKILGILCIPLLLLGWWVFQGAFSSSYQPPHAPRATLARQVGPNIVDKMPKSQLGIALDNGAPPPAPTVVQAPAPDTSQKDALIDELTRQNQALIDELKKQKEKPAPDPGAAQRREEARRVAEERRKEDDHARQTLVFWAGGKGEGSRAGGVGLQPPVGSLMLARNWKINCITETAINSDIPGPISVRTLEPAYDSVTGTAELIPPGSSISSQQSGQVIAGDRRIPVRVSSIGLPDGSSLTFGGGMSMLDQAGQAGLSGDVDHHFGKLAMSVILTSVLKMGSYTTGGMYGADVSDRLGDSLAREAGQEGTKQVRQSINTSPTITAPRNSPCLLMVDQDIAFPKAYQPVVR